MPTSGRFLFWDSQLQMSDGADYSTATFPTSGTYTPTRSAESNLDANVTPSEAQYMRVGNTVTVSGRVTGIDPTSALISYSFELSLPVASNVGAVEDVAGVANNSAGTIGNGAITGSVANDTAVFAWGAGGTSSFSVSYIYTYQVI